MAYLKTLFREVDRLTAAELQQLYNYIIQNRVKFLESKESPTPLEPRVAGLHEHLGHAWMSDDFNAPLPDEFWLGQE